MKKTLLVFSFLCSLLAANRSFGDVGVTVPAGLSFIANPVDNPPNTLAVLLPNVPDQSLLYTWNCGLQAYDAPQQFIAGSGWFDSSFNPSTTVLTPGQGAVFDNPGGSTVLNFVGPPAIPTLPPAAYCGCGVYSLLGLQGTNLSVGGFQDITGMAPIDGAELLSFNGSGFVDYTYNTPGGWSPSTPMVNVGQGVFIVMPCSTNPCLVVTCPTNKSVPCSSTNWVFDLPIVMDSCCSTNSSGGPGYTINVTSTVTTNAGPCNQISTRTWTITDCTSNTVTCTQSVTLLGSPSIICPTNKTVTCASNIVFDPPGVVSACCGTNFVISILSTVTTNTGPCTSVSTRTWQIIDCCGNTNICSQMVTVVPGPLSAPCSTILGANLVPNPGFENYTSCPNGFSEIYLAAPWFQPTQGTPDFFNACASGSVVGVPVNAFANLNAHSGQGYAGGNQFTWNGTGAPDSGREYLETPLSTTLTAGHTYQVSFYVSLEPGCRFAVDDLGAYFSQGQITDGTTAGTLTNSSGAFYTPQVQNPAGQFLTSTTGWMLVRGTFIATGVEDYVTLGNFADDPNTPYLTFPANASYGAYYFYDDVAVQEVTLNCTSNKTVPCSSNWVFDTPVFTNACCGTNIAVSILSTVTTNTGPCTEISTRTWLATDCCGNTNTWSETVTVTSAPPVIICPTNKTIPCTSNLVFDLPGVVAPCCGTNYSISILSTVTTNNSGGCGETSTRTWLITDCCGNSNTCSQTVTVTGSVMVVTCPTNKTIPCTSNVVFDLPGVSSPCCGTNYTISILSTVTTNTGGCGEMSTRTWLITDCCGNSNTCSQTVTVTGSAMVITCSTNKTIPCTSNVVFNPPTVSSPCCGTNYSISILSTVTTNTGGCGEMSTRTWLITDCCGNSNTCSQTVTVTGSAMVVTCPTNKTISCNSNVVFNPPTVSSPCCGTNYTISIISTTTNNVGPCTLVQIRTWSITDCCGNSNTCSQTVTVTHPPPVFVGIASKTYPCGTNWNWNTPVAVDACCGTNVAVGILSTTSTGTNPEILTRTWVATNCCGLTNTFTEVVTLLNNPPPNDECTNAIRVYANTTLCGTTLCATPSLADTLFPAPCGNSLNSPDVWYLYTSECGGTVTVDTCGACPGMGNFNTVLSVYTGECGQLMQVACNDDAPPPHPCGTQSLVTFTAQGCSTYYIRVAGHNGASGNFQLNIGETTTPPANDLCANATLVGNGTFPFQNCGANTDGPNTPTNCPTYNDVWFRYTAPCTGTMWAETCDSCFSTVLSAYSGTCGNLHLITCNEHATAGRCVGSLSSFVSFNVTAGTTYYLRVGSSVLGVTGSGFLTVSGPFPSPQHCPPVGPAYCRYFDVVGAANNTPWSWSIEVPCCMSIQVTNVPGVPVGAPPAALAAAFVASINNVGCAGMVASTAGLPAGWFRVCVSSCSSPAIPFIFRVGAAGTPAQSQCVVVGPALPTSGPCSFNPDIFDLPTSGQDLNTNGIDDAIDILDGTSLDLDQNGIPDEVQSCVPPILTDYPDSQSVQLGANVSLSAAASGTPAPVYQWSFNGVPLSDGGNISGSASNVLSILSATLTNLGDYTVTVSNACGGATSTPATLSAAVTSIPVIAGSGFQPDGSFQFNFQTQAGINYVIEYTEDLTSPAWIALETVQGDGDVRQMADLWPVGATRFYRVRTLGP